MGFDPHRGVQAETVDVGAQRLGHPVLARHRSPQRQHLLPGSRAKGDAVSDGRRLQRPQRARLLAVGIRLGQLGLAYVLDQHAPAREQLHEPSGAHQLAEAGVADDVAAEAPAVEGSVAAATPSTASVADPETDAPFAAAHSGATLPPWSVAHAHTNLYGPNSRNPAAQKSVTATVVGNVRVSEVGTQGRPDYDTHHIVLDFGTMPFPVLEGQSIGVVPPGSDGAGRSHDARQYSVASPRNGERPGYNNVSLTIKRVLEDYAGQPVRGVASNYMCDLAVGDKVRR